MVTASRDCTQSRQQKWAEENFGNCRLGDARRTERLVKTAKLILNNPAVAIGSLDGQWKNAKAAYRLFANKGVTFEATMETHCTNTKKKVQGKHSLMICDTSEVIFGKNREIEEGGDLGRRAGSGFLLHPALAVDADTGQLQGLAGAVIRHRKRAPKKENASQRKKRQRESAIWGDVIDQVGTPDDDTQYTTICDRGADSFEILCHLQKNHHDFIIRVCQRHRNITPTNGEECQLKLYIERQTVVGTYEVELRSRKSNKGKKSKSRVAKMEVRLGKVRISAPVHKSTYEKESGIAWVEMSVVWTREVDCPKGVEPLDWMIYTSHDVTSFDDACKIINWYKERWLVEEFFKALKTGCRMEVRQLRSSNGLESLCGVLCVTAFELLRLKRISQSAPLRPARKVVPPLWVEMLRVAMQCQRRHVETIEGFCRTLARLGGFLGRRSDGNPGWQKLWAGWSKLNSMVHGAEVLTKLKQERCG